MLGLFLLSVSLFSQQNLLDKIALEAGTDKSSKIHNYTDVYEQYFGNIRNSNLKFLEIGIAGSNSVKMWDKYFQNAESTLYFIDIDQTAVNNCQKLIDLGILTRRVIPYQADQANKSHLKNFIDSAGGEFDVIIDDGGHTMIQQIESFCFLFPYLKKGGVYIVEDLHTSFWPLYGGGMVDNLRASSSSTLHFLKNLVDEVNQVGAVTGLGDVYNCPDKNLKNYYQRHIRSIHFYNSLCFIFKY